MSEVVVVGGGIMGLATATELAKRGVRVTVLEKDRLGFEASSRNMGAIGVLGKHAADIAALSVDAWDRLDHDLPDSFDYLKTGRLYIAYTDDDRTKLEGMGEHAAAGGIPVELLEPDAVRRRFPAVQIPTKGAVYSNLDAQVHAESVVAAYGRAARAAGVVIDEGRRVDEVILANGQAVGVHTDSGDVSADAVLVAGGVWAWDLLEPLGLRYPHQIIALQNAETTPQSDVLPFFLRGPDYSARQLSSGIIRLGGGYRIPGAWHSLGPQDFRNLTTWFPRLWQHRSELKLRVDKSMLARDLKAFVRRPAPAPRGFEPYVSASNIEEKLKHLIEAVPALSGARIATAWGGLVDMTPDALPVIGPVRAVPGLHVALGFNGQGFGLGPVVGSLLAQAITNEDTEIPLTKYRPERFAEEKVPAPAHLI